MLGPSIQLLAPSIFSSWEIHTAPTLEPGVPAKQHRSGRLAHYDVGRNLHPGSHSSYPSLWRRPVQDIAEGNPGVAVEALRGALQDVSNWALNGSMA